MATFKAVQAVPTPGVPMRVQSATGNTGASAATTIAVNMVTAPANGNTMIAVISTRGTSSDRVTSITQTGATWTRAAQTVGTAGTTTEIWVAPNVAAAAAAVTINQASLLSAAVVLEYSGVLAVSPLDKTASITGSSTAAATGTTVATTQAIELWIGGSGLVSSSYTLGNPNNSFTAVASAQSAHTTAASNAKVYALERIVGGTGTASSGGTVSTSSQWSGAIATFKAAATLTLGGAAAANYTLIGATGTVAITPADLTITADNQSKTYGQSVTFGSGSTQFTSSGLQNGETIGSVTLACDGGGAAAAVAPYPITPGAATAGTFSAANYAISYVPGTLTVNPASFATWALDPAQGLNPGVNDGPLQDPDHDGISNLLEFTLGGAPMVSSQAILPVLTKHADAWIFEYERSDLSKSATTQIVEYGDNLTGWTQIPIPAVSNSVVTVTPGTSSDHVQVIIPVPGGKVFARLKVTQ
jgi:hypothetical protein